MKIQFKYLLFVIISALAYLTSYSQNTNNFQSDYPQIKSYFRSSDLVVDPAKSFFNVLTVVNNGNSTEVVFVDFNAPLGWTIIKNDRQNYTIDARDSVRIPIRVAATKDVKGDIGYSIIGSVNDRDGQTLSNAYCYVKIPRVSDLVFRPVSRVSYFDQQKGDSELSFLLNNRGNVNELINITLTSNENITLPNEKDNTLAYDILLESGKDTIVKVPVKFKNNDDQSIQTMFRVDLAGVSDATIFNTTFWFKYLTDDYRHEIPPGEIPLILEIMMHNLFSQYSPYFSGNIAGNILFKKNRNINYRFRVYGIGRSNDFMSRSRFRVAYNSTKFDFIVGDLSGLALKHGLGRGLQVNYRLSKRHEIFALASENQFRPIINYGGGITSRLKLFSFSPRFAYVDNKFHNSLSEIYGLNTNFNAFRNHKLTIDAGISDATFTEVDKQEIGYGFRVNYSGRIKNLRFRLNEQFGTTNYYGHYAGRHNLYGMISYPYKHGYLFDLIFSDRINNPIIENSDGIFSETFHSSRIIQLRTTKYMDKGYALFFSPIYENQGSNAFYLYNGNDPFITNSAKFEVGTRIRESYNEYFNPSLALGYTWVSDYSEPGIGTNIFNLSSRDKFFNAHFSLNMKRGKWGTYLNYFYGPYALNQQLQYFYNNYYTQSIRVMPYYESFVYKNIVKLTSKINFMYDFTYKTTRMHMHNEIDLFFKKGFTLSLLNTLSYQVSTDLITEDKYDYSNAYFEIKLKKDFHWNQPRIKYHDLTVSLFRDLNGNLKKDPNEPGVNNVLVSIYREDPKMFDEFDKEYEYTGQLVNNRLLSGSDGTVSYKNLAAGLYRIEINNIDKNGSFVPDFSELLIEISEDKIITVPFLERNKIFGRVVLNRSKLSTLGRIDVSNIRVNAVDTRGNTISTLTDKQGEFELYAPSIDDYIVSVHNIFKEQFNLRQDSFYVHLNAYKQFEVNFVFDEKRRQIDFHAGDMAADADIVSVRRTNLSGVIKDRTTLQPLRATVEVVDNTSGRSIETTRSDRNTGRFHLSFMTGENYSVIASAPGYWMYSDKLELEQVLTIQDVEKEILLDNIIIGSKIELRNLQFTKGSAEIPNDAYPELDRLIEQLKQNPNVKIQIAGHSDALETIDHRDISATRAENVARYMFEQGFGNIDYVGFEDKRPIATNDNEENRRKNRRVEITIIDK